MFTLIHLLPPDAVPTAAAEIPATLLLASVTPTTAQFSGDSTSDKPNPLKH